MASSPQLPSERTDAPAPGAPVPPPVVSPPAAPVVLAPLAGGPVWPKVIGVLSIVMGGKELVSGATGTILYAQTWIGEMDVTNLSAPLFNLPAAATGVTNIGSMILVAAGVLLLFRRRATVLLHWLAAGITLIAAAIWVAWSVGFVLRYSEAWGLLLRVGLGRMVRLAYPVFTVVWLLRRPIRQQMRAWRTRAGRQAARHVGTAWPAVVGVLAMVGGGTALAMGLAMLTCRLLSGDGPLPVATGLEAFLFGISVLELPVRVVEITGGWLLTRRRRAGLVCLLIYAVIWLVLSVVCPVIDLVWASRQMGPWRMLPYYVTHALLRAAFPVFLLVWFARPRVRAHIRCWANPPPGGTGTV